MDAYRQKTISASILISYTILMGTATAVWLMGMPINYWVVYMISTIAMWMAICLLTYRSNNAD